MVGTKNGRSLVAVALTLAFISALIAGCSGDTDGGSGNDTAAPGPLYVADGGAGATLTIKVSGALTTGGTTGFSVTALDPSGGPLAFIRIFCESERGIAIIEPSSGGVAFEHTGPNGLVSGVLGGLTPGSFILECRAPIGFGLVDRVQIVVSGDVPDGFAGFPGAAGGNLGGGVFVDETPPATGDGVSVAYISINTPSDNTSTGPVDLLRDPDCNDDGVFDDPETYIFNTLNVGVSNDSSERIFLGSATITIAGDGVTLSTVLSANTELAPGASAPDGLGGNVVLPFTEFIRGTDTKTLAGTVLAIPFGTYPVSVSFTGTTENGDAFTIEGTTSITFGFVDNC